MRRPKQSSAEGDPETVRQARRYLARSIRTFPGSKRAYLYWVWSLLAPSTFPAYRRRLLERRLHRTH